MYRPLYQHIASTLQARANCIAKENTDCEEMFFDPAPNQPSLADTPDLMVPEYIQGFDRLDTTTGLNRIISLKAVLERDPGARVALRAVADIRRDNEHPQNRWSDVSTFLSRLHPKGLAVVVIRP